MGAVTGGARSGPSGTDRRPRTHPPPPAAGIHRRRVRGRRRRRPASRTAAQPVNLRPAGPSPPQHTKSGPPPEARSPRWWVGCRTVHRDGSPDRCTLGFARGAVPGGPRSPPSDLPKPRRGSLARDPGSRHGSSGRHCGGCSRSTSSSRLRRPTVPGQAGCQGGLDRRSRLEGKGVDHDPSRGAGASVDPRVRHQPTYTITASS
jgi:hypothetical protein